MPALAKKPPTADRDLTVIAMVTAAVLLAHQLAGRAFREAAFLTEYPVASLH